MITKWNRLRNGQRGEGKIGAIIAVLVIALVVHVGMKFIPFKIQTAEFEKAVEVRLERLAGNLLTEDEFLEGVMEAARQQEVPLTEENLRLELVGATYRVNAEYEVVLEMLWGEWAQKVEIFRERPKF